VLKSRYNAAQHWGKIHGTGMRNTEADTKGHSFSFEKLKSISLKFGKLFCWSRGILLVWVKT